MDRFWAKVDTHDDGCWLWNGTLTQKGYGQFAVAPGEVWRAHRFAWFLEHGPIPEGMAVTMTCGIASCVRPDHLELKTRSEASRLRGSGRRRQDRLPKVVASPEQTRLIRELHANGAGERDLARVTGLGIEAIRLILEEV